MDIKIGVENTSALGEDVCLDLCNTSQSDILILKTVKVIYSTNRHYVLLYSTFS